MIIYLISFLLLMQTSEIPYRAKENYQVELKYDLKARPAKDHNSVNLDPNAARGIEENNYLGPLPYLTIKIKILNHVPEEIRFRCENNFGNSLFNRKAEKSLAYEIDMGYLDDVKDRVTAHSYTLYAMTEKKVALNKIEFVVQEDGTFMVNGEKRGKF